MTNTDETSLIIERDGGLLQLTLNRPDCANALNLELAEALIGEITTAEGVQLCVIRGAGRNFCGGFDLADLDTASDGDLLWRFLRIETLLQAVYHAPFAVVALAQGQAVGAGADLFNACWQRVAAPDARFKMPGWNFELALGTRRLMQRVGQDAARDLLIDTQTLSAEQSLACGLATEVASLPQWPALIDQFQQRTSTLPAPALANMLALTTHDSRNDDMAAIVASAGRPGLRERILAYRGQIFSAKHLPVT